MAKAVCYLLFFASPASTFCWLRLPKCRQLHAARPRHKTRCRCRQAACSFCHAGCQARHLLASRLRRNSCCNAESVASTTLTTRVELRPCMHVRAFELNCSHRVVVEVFAVI
ncbi:hypothetical protein NPIL_128631 [Nephila pilipes]|uniref:Secreted protein n=1 Tax=Nephila pilipes TaxID=299642 RepID=A0A8X6QBM3_NEPPI|nr:hypothetical protein NPIL_128631 [Nephila pilipes]